MSELPGTRSLCVLVVDDCTDTADSLAELLRFWGHRPVVAHDGGVALEAALAQPPDVVLLDLALPGLDGFEVARRLRCQGLRGTLVAAVTGYSDPSTRRRADEAGFDLYLLKPLDLDWLRRLLALRQQAGGPSPSVAQEAQGAQQMMDPAGEAHARIAPITRDPDR